MIVRYPTSPATSTALPADTTMRTAAERAGSNWVFCDVSTCPASEELGPANVYDVPGGSVEHVAMPDGWVTSDPDGNALNGAAQFCGTHSARVSG